MNNFSKNLSALTIKNYNGHQIDIARKIDGVYVFIDKNLIDPYKNYSIIELTKYKDDSVNNRSKFALAPNISDYFAEVIARCYIDEYLNVLNNEINEEEPAK